MVELITEVRLRRPWVRTREAGHPVQTVDTIYPMQPYLPLNRVTVAKNPGSPTCLVTWACGIRPRRLSVHSERAWRPTSTGPACQGPMPSQYFTRILDILYIKNHRYHYSGLPIDALALFVFGRLNSPLKTHHHNNTRMRVASALPVFVAGATAQGVKGPYEQCGGQGFADAACQNGWQCTTYK